jgi:hypothetical protein
MSVSMEKVMEKLEERKVNLKAKLWDSLTDVQNMGIYKYATEEQEELWDASDDKAAKWDSLTDKQIEVIYESLSKKQEWLLTTLEDIEVIEHLLQHGEWPGLPEEDQFNEE